jgi:hypothetical protein
MYALLTVIGAGRRARPVLAAALVLFGGLALSACRQVLGIEVLRDPVADGGPPGLGDASDRGDAGDSGRPDGAATSDGGLDAASDGASDAGQMPVLAASLTAKSSFDFGTATVGQTAPTGQIQITNGGNAPTAKLATHLTGAAFSVVSDACTGVVLQPALSCTVTVSVQTTAAGSLSGTLQVVDTAADQVSVALTATVLARGALAVSPDSQPFADTPVGSTSAPASFTVTNTGGVATGTITTTLGGTNASEFTMSDGCTGRALGPAETCTIQITFAPATAGPKTASLAVSADPGGTGTASLTGRGQAPASLSIAPTTASFSTFQLFAPPTTTPTATFIVSNSGDLPSVALSTALSLGTGTANGEFKIASDSCNGQPVAPMSTCTVVVQFSPTTHGNKSGSLKISPGPLTATFTGSAADQVALTVTKSGTGSGTVTDGSGLINCGSTCSAEVTRTTTDPVVTLTATPGTQSVFAGWSGGGCTGTATTCQVTLSAATTVTAQFNPTLPTLSVNFHGIGNQTASIASSPAGIACSGNCSATGTYNPGTKVTLTVTQASGAKIAWSNGCSGTTCAITLGSSGATTVNVTSTNQNVVFKTSQTHSGNFGGLAGANAYCNSAAAAAGVPGTFVAFLGTLTGTRVTPFQALGSARGWIRIDGLPFTDTVSGFMSNVMWYPAALDEYGNAATMYHYTGFDSDSCGDWTSSSSTEDAIGGGPGEAQYFYEVFGISCAASSIVCFGTDFTNPVSVTPANGRHVFATSSAFDAAQGLAAADALCQSSAQSAGLANPANFKAALATTSASVQSRFNLSGAPWVRTDGVLVASSPANFMAGTLIAPPGVDETGKPNTFQIWLGSSQGMAGAAANGATDCNDWTNDTKSATGNSSEPIWGGPAAPNAFQYTSGTQTCDSGLTILCLEN